MKRLESTREEASRRLLAAVGGAPAEGRAAG